MSRLIKFGCMLIAIFGFAMTASAYEGYSPVPTGGAGGTTVHVTNLNDSGTGSFRAAVTGLNGSATIIVFDVNGVICTSSETEITKPNVTVDGTSAPGNGIMIAANTGAAGPPLGINANNVIISNLRLCQVDPANVSECIGIWGGVGIVIDHCSMTNAGDSSIFITDSGESNIIISRCLFGGDVEAMRGHGAYISMHHCFFSWNDRRQPRIYETTGPWDLRNCIVDHWTGTGTNILLASNVNVINNWYGNPAPKPGADCSAGFLASSLSGDTNVYINGNDSNCGQNIDGLTQISTPNPEPNVTTELASAVPADVLGDVGAQPNDAVDQYYINGGGLNPPLPPSCAGGSSSGGGGGGGIGWSESADYYVDGLVGSDSNPGTSTQPWATLTKAVSTATAGKKVLVWGGQASGVIYTGQLTFSNSGTSSSPITFTRDPASGMATIDGNGTTSGTLYTTGAKYIVIDGFTITDGKYGVYTYGSGATNWTIKNSRITGNSTYGIYNRSGAGMTIFNDAVYLNGGSTGYGIYIYNSGATAAISQCDVYGQKYGINNSTSATSTVTNSIVSGNSIYGIYNKSSTITITYTDVYGQSTNYSGCSAGTGCISSDPLWDDPGSGVFTLGTGSPCIGTASDGGNMGYRLGGTAL